MLLLKNIPSLVSLRLDVPTFDDPIIQAKLAQIRSIDDGAAWGVVEGTVEIISSIVDIISQLSVLLSLVQSEQGGWLLATLACAEPIMNLTGRSHPPSGAFTHEDLLL